MASYALLNNIEHKNLKVITRYSVAFGDNVTSVITFPAEYDDIQREYPIFFRKDPGTNDYLSVAILGFETDENLFLDKDRWLASYVPSVVEKGPFVIGFQEQDIDGKIRKEPVIYLDIESPRLSQTEGEAVFLEHGGNSPYIEKIASILNGIHDGMVVSKNMFKLFTEFDLIEPVNIEVRFDQNTIYKLLDYYTISEEKLAALDGNSLEKLNKAGLLQAAFLVIASMNNMKKLITMKRQRFIKSNQR